MKTSIVELISARLRIGFKAMRSFTLVRNSVSVFAVLLIAACSPATDYSEPPAPTGDADGLLPPHELAGGSLRAVWIREIGDGTDWHAATGNVILMGFDSEDGEGVRILHEGYPNYNKPLLSPDGQAVIFTDLSDRRGTVVKMDWASRQLVPLGSGLALDVWKEPGGTVWVYVGEGPMDGRGNVSKVERFPLEDPSARELVWDHKVARDNFQLDSTGTYAGGLFPAAPAGGLLNLETLEFDVYSPGCWASISPGTRRLVWVFDGRHRNLQFFATSSEFQPLADSERWIVNSSGAPGIDGVRTYYPRWSNHSRFFAVAGPMPHGNYGRAEIYVGRFSKDYKKVEAWSRLTNNDRLDMFPDVRVVPGGEPANARGQSTDRSGERALARSFERFETEGVLIEKTRTPRPNEIGNYRSARAVYRYRVEAMPETGMPGEVLVAHWVIRDLEVLRDFRREIGESYPLVLEIYDGNPKFQGQRVVSDLNEGAETLFVDVSNHP